MRRNDGQQVKGLANAIDTRNEIVLSYIDMVKYIANKLTYGCNYLCEYDDLVNFGIIGLIDAIERYEPNENAKFSTYAYIKIRGAMLDGIKNISGVPVAASIEDEEFRLGEKIAAQYMSDECTDDSIEKLDEFLRLLTERDRAVIDCYYYKGLTFKQIGETLNLSESRISQIHKNVIRKLRSIVK